MALMRNCIIVSTLAALVASPHATCGSACADDATLLLQAQIVQNSARESSQISQDAAGEDMLEKETLHQMWICNAYTENDDLTVTLRRTGKALLTLRYKECQSVSAPVVNTDHLDFQHASMITTVQTVQTNQAAMSPGVEAVVEAINDETSSSGAASTIDTFDTHVLPSATEDVSAPQGSVGTFYLTQLPSVPDAPLVLVAYRRADASVGDAIVGEAATFASHAFASQAKDGAAQVAVIDAFSATVADGASLATTEGASEEGGDASAGGIWISTVSNESTPELLPSNSMVEVSPGTYELKFGEQQKLAHEIRLDRQADLLIVRVGNGANSKDFPEDLIIFPQLSAAVKPLVGWLACIALLLALF